MPNMLNFPQIFGSKRALVIILLAVTNIATFFGSYLTIRRLNVEYFHDRYPLLDIMRHFSNPKDLLTTLQPIREELRFFFEKEDLEFTSLYLEYLNTGANISINPDIRILPASLVKVPLAMAVMKKIERGDWQLHNQLILTKDDRDTSWGEVYNRPIGMPIAIKDLLEEMLLHSDNTAFRILYRNMDLEEVRDVYIALGLDDFFDQEGKITAKEYTRLLRSLYTANYLSPYHSQYVLNILTHTNYDDYLGGGIPEEITFAHKIGENNTKTVVLDAGMVYIDDRVYLISMAMDYEKEGVTREKALEIFGYVSDRIYRYMSQTNNEKL